MSPENSTKILTTHDLNNLRANISTTPGSTTAVLAATAHGLRSTGTIVATAPGSANTNQLFNNSLSNLFTATAATKGTILNTTNLINVITSNATNSTHHHHNNNNSLINNNIITANGNTATTMPTTSKYVFLQQQSNGQYTTFEGTTTASTGSSGNTSTNVGNIVLLATEAMDVTSTQGSEQHIIATATPANVTNSGPTATGIIATSSATGAGAVAAGEGGGVFGDNDEELRPLAWLNDCNLIKGIVTTQNIKTHLATTGNGNICIVNTSNAHELIEELPHNVINEENIHHTEDSQSHLNITNVEQQPITLSVSEYQQQFIASSKRFNNTLDASKIASTSLHVGPSGTTTVVEYKSTNNNLNNHFIPTQRQIISNNLGNNLVANATTITVTNSNNPSNSNNHTNNSFIQNSTATVLSTKHHTHQIPHQHIVLPSSLISNASNPTVISNQNNQINNTNIVNCNGTSNTIYQGHKIAQALQAPQQHQQQSSATQQTSQAQNSSNQQSGVASANTSSTNINVAIKTNNGNGTGIASGTGTSSSTIHHPHKKYLRENMSVLVEQGNATISSGTVNANATNSSSGNTSSTGNTVTNIGTVTVVAPPVSTTSLSSIGTSILNTNSSAIKTSTYASNTSSNGISTTSSANSLTGATYVATIPSSGVVSSTAYSSSSIPTAAFTIVSQNPNSSPEISVASTQSQKYFYTNNHPTQSMRSPTSYSSYDDSLKDFDIETNGGRIQTSTPQQQHQSLSQATQPATPKSSSSSSAVHSFSTLNNSSSSISSTTSNGQGNNSSGSGSTTPQKQKHPTNVPYDPQIHTHNKPPYSFSSLIFMAIEDSNEKALPVKEIYAWIVQRFPYFRTAPTGWKNSVRHNLSLNKSFVKVEKAPNMGKGSLWRVEPQQRQNLMQALTRSPFYQNSGVDKISFKANEASPGGGGDYDGVVDGIITKSNNRSFTGSPTNNICNSLIDGSGNCGASTASNSNRYEQTYFTTVPKGSGNDYALNDVIDRDDEIPSDYNAINNTHIENGHTNNVNNSKYKLSSSCNQNLNGESNNRRNQNHNQNNNQNHNHSNIHAHNHVDTTNSNNNNSSTNTSTNSSPNSENILGSFSSYENLFKNCGADSVDAVNAAAAMLALKHGPNVFTDTFQNGAPVITSSPSEDHTYSAGGNSGSASGSGSNNSNANSGSSTPLLNGNSNGFVYNSNGNVHSQSNQFNNHHINPNTLDNQSNCASSDAAYESSEENHNVTPEELDDQQRHRDGVDALLYLSLSSMVDATSSSTATCMSGSQSSSTRSTSSSPNKRRSSMSVEEAHYKSYSNDNLNNNNNNHNNHNNNNNNNSIRSKMSLLSSVALVNANNHAVNGRSSMMDEGYYGKNNNVNNGNISHHNQSDHSHHHSPNNHSVHFAGSNGMRKSKQSRSVRTKIKKKGWMR